MRRKTFTGDERGAAAIEYALVLPLLIGVIIGTVEIGVVGLVSNNLDNSLETAARKIRVGEAGAPASASQMKDAICARMFESRTSCLAKLAVSVRKFPDFAGAKAAAGDPPTGQFDQNAAGDIVLVKATYRWPFFMPFFTLGLPQSGPTTVVLDARTAFKNEPYA